jgi:tetratricopeptide (TPR) repeat protein
MDYLSLCLICKDENDYLPEWLDYHILMGVDRFYIYDNDSQVSLCESLKDYIDRNWVVIINITGKGMQLHAYDHCLKTFGSSTFWLGFIDTDEFLVPKTCSDLKEFLKEYEAYAGLAISSFFFGSNNHQTRPAAGQLASYTRRTHITFQGNNLVKSLVQPARTLMPNSPHDFAYKENSWCVNEDKLLVDGMKFPHHSEKIQLNHYFCRSQSDIDQKLARGQVYTTEPWPRERFNVVNNQSVYNDKAILEKLAEVLETEGLDISGLVDSPETFGLLEKMTLLCAQRRADPMGLISVGAAGLQISITSLTDLKVQILKAEKREEFGEAVRLIILRLEMMPNKISLLVDLSANYLHMGDTSAAWQILSQAWKIGPNSYSVLTGMAYFFLQVRDFEMAEKACSLLLEMAPHNLMILGYLTEALMGQGRSEEALKVGLPLIELDDVLSELPKGMASYLAKKMSDTLLEKKNHGPAPLTVKLANGNNSRYSLQARKDN